MRRFKKWAKLLGVLVLLGVAGFCLLVGFFWIEHTWETNLPTPTGRYAVGRIECHWVDSKRIDSLAPSETRRELPIWIWYPADVAAGDRPSASYLPPQWAAALEKAQGLVMSKLLTRDPSRVHPHAVQDAGLSPDQARYPVLLFKSGIGALATDYTTLCENLASHGYIVVASDAPYSTFVAVMSDGRVVRRSPAGSPGHVVDSAEGKALADKVIQIWSADLRFELDQLEQIDKQDPSNRFTGRLNLGEIGVFGHSFGGATAAQFCHDDRRCRAGIDIDGRLFGNVVQAGVGKPFLFLLGEHAHESDPQSEAILQEIQSVTQGLSNWPNHITLRGAHHFNFSDMALTKERHAARFVGAIGPIDERRALSVTADYVRAFFDTHLKNTSDPLMNGSSDRYPEAEIQSRRPTN